MTPINSGFPRELAHFGSLILPKNFKGFIVLIKFVKLIFFINLRKLINPKVQRPVQNFINFPPLILRALIRDEVVEPAPLCPKGCGRLPVVYE